MASEELAYARQHPQDDEPLTTRLLEIPVALEPAQVALAICATVLSHRGSAVVVGRRILIESEAPNVAQAQDLVKALER